MTALAGFWARHGGARAHEDCEKMLNAQRIYGTGRGALWQDAGLALGRRLTPALPEDKWDNGPVTGGGGRWTLIADVRLDDRAELGAELGIGGEEAALLSDSALVMKAIERLGEEKAIARLIGDFALALWDRDRQQLLLARDFLGQRPLFYSQGPSFFAFSSMVKGLHALPQVPKAADEETVGHALALMHRDNHSLYAGIKRVLPGELCAVAADRVQRRRVWTFDREPLRLKTSGDYHEAVRETFDRSVAARLRGAGGYVAAHLSGGLDSSAVAATAARLIGAGGKVAAFTAVPGEGYAASSTRRIADEGPHAAAVAALYPNMEHVLVKTGGMSPMESLDRDFYLCEHPILNVSNRVWGHAIADRAKQRGITVLLSGQMGNIGVSHDGLELVAELLAQGRLVQFAREAALARRSGLRLGTIAAQALRPFLPDAAWRTIHRLRRRDVGMAAQSVANPALLAAVTAKAERESTGARGRESVQRRVRTIERTDHGVYHKGLLAGWGLDERDPTADRRLIELCLSIPAEQYFDRGRTRALARGAFSDRLPALVVEETLKGFQAADWHEGMIAAQDAVCEEVARIVPLPAAARLFDIPRMTRLARNMPHVDWHSHEAELDYRQALLRGVSIGHFLRKCSGRN